jgi:hypothetical protein
MNQFRYGARSALLGPEPFKVLFTNEQCCGTVMIYYGPGSLFGKVFFPVSAPIPVPVPDPDLFSKVFQQQKKLYKNVPFQC